MSPGERLNLTGGFLRKPGFVTTRSHQTPQRRPPFWSGLLGLTALGLELCALGYLARFYIAPQGDQELSRQGHDADLAHPLAAMAKPLLVPESQLTVWLVA